MRKDLVFGMSIGGVLLAIGVICYTLSGHKPKALAVVDGTPGSGEIVAPGAAGDDAAPGDRSAEVTPGVPGGRPSAAMRAEAGGSVDAAPSQSGGAPEDRTDSGWYKALYGPDATPLVSATPDAAQVAAGTRLIISAPVPRPGEISSGTLGGGPVHLAPTNSAITPGGSAAAVASGVTGGTKMRQHRVQSGENFSSIAAVAYGSASDYPLILRANPSVDPRKLRPGMLINLPEAPVMKAAADPGNLAYATVAPSLPGTPGTSNTPTARPVVAGKEYQVQSGDSLHRIATKLYGTISMVQPLYEANKDKIGPDPAKLKLGMVLKLPAAPKG